MERVRDHDRRAPPIPDYQVAAGERFLVGAVRDRLDRDDRLVRDIEIDQASRS